MKQKYKFGSTNFKNTLISANGPKHAEGGIAIGKSVEIEGGEGVYDGFVFSDRLLTEDGLTFAEASKKIEKRYKNSNDRIDKRTKELELKRLMDAQEAMKAEIAAAQSDSTKTKMPALPIDTVGRPDTMQTRDPQMMPMPEPIKFGSGGDIGKKLIIGKAIGSAAGSLINVGRGLWEKPRQYDPIEFERAKWEDATFDTVDFDTVDYSDQRNRAALNARRSIDIGNRTIRNNAGNAGQLLSNSVANIAKNNESLNELQRESFMTEENTNVNIGNRENMINTQIDNQFSQFNTSGRNRTNMFNTQIDNQEVLQNYQIDMMNAQNEDAQRQLMWDGIGGLLSAGTGALDGLYQKKLDEMSLAAAKLGEGDINAFMRGIRK